jgi:hypothetical protein
MGTEQQNNAHKTLSFSKEINEYQKKFEESFKKEEIPFRFVPEEELNKRIGKVVKFRFA